MNILETILELFGELQLESFDFINDQAKHVDFNCPHHQANSERYGCGLFLFSKKCPTGRINSQISNL